MRYVSTRGGSPPVALADALVRGLAPDGGLYVPDRVERWAPGDVADLPSMPIGEIGRRVLRPYVAGELDAAQLTALVNDALDFPMPLVEVEPGVCALELFHGPTLAFKDVGARVMARLMAALGSGDPPLTVLVATSGDTGSAVAHAFHGVAGTRVVALYPDGRVSPTQEAQLTMFNGPGTNVRAYAVAGSFDDCQRLVKGAFADNGLRRRVRLTSANSINVGRLLPQMIYYFLAAKVDREVGPRPIVSVPSGNFGNLTAGLMARRAGAPIARFVAATTINDVVPEYLRSGTFAPRRSVATLANAMDVGDPSNFERMRWLFGGDADAMRAEVCGSVHTDEDVRATIGGVHQRCGYLLDPHSAIAYLGLSARGPREAPEGKGPSGLFLATAHPAKFREIVEPIIGRSIPLPTRLAEALARPRCVIRMDATRDALAAALVG
jgi:threonine synthase